MTSFTENFRTSVCHSLCMPICAPTLQCISLWLQLQCSYVHFHQRNNSTKPAHCSTIQSVKNSATQYSTVQHGTVLYLNRNGSSDSRVSRAECDLHPVWIWSPIKDVSGLPDVPFSVDRVLQRVHGSFPLSRWMCPGHWGAEEHARGFGYIPYRQTQIGTAGTWDGALSRTLALQTSGMAGRC